MSEPQALLLKAAVLDCAGQSEEAREAYAAFLLLEPTHAGAWADYGGLLMVMGRLEEAHQACQRSLELLPDYPPASVNLALTLMHLGRLDEAEFLCRRLLLREPQNGDALLALSDVYLAKKELGMARATLARLLAREPSHARARLRLHNIFVWQRDWTALRPSMEEQLSTFSGAEAEYEMSHLRLLYGEVPEAWKAFESRLAIPGRITPQRAFNQPSWRGGSFVHETLLVHWEQGFGDTLMFLRFLPQVKALGGRVLLLVQPELAELAATCPGADLVLQEGDPLPPFDLHISLMSLPSVFGTDWATLPATVPYLDVPERVPHREEISQALTSSEGSTRVGLVWAGNPKHHRDSERSLADTSLAPLAALPGVAWFSFQLGRENGPPLVGLRPLAPLLGDFSDTAYALSGMDLVIGVDTALVHLAGALGIPTLLLLTFQPDWRWMLEREDSPWYPSLRLYRQPQLGDWDAVIARMVQDLSMPA